MIKSLILIGLSLVLLCCNTGTSTEKFRMYEGMFTHAIDLKKHVSDTLRKRGYILKALHLKRVKATLAYGIATVADGSNNVDYFYWVFDLDKNDLTHLISNPFLELKYYDIEYDYDAGQFFIYHGAMLNDVYAYDCITHRVDTLNLPHIMLPGSLNVIGNLFIFYNSPLGSAVFDIKKGDSLLMRNSQEIKLNYRYAAISIPVSKNINLISGTRKEDSLLLLVYDSGLNQLQSKYIETDKVMNDAQVKILPVDGGFIFFDISSASFFDWHKDSIVWRVSLPGKFQNVLSIDQKSCLVITTEKVRMSIIKMDNLTGVHQWKKTFKGTTVQNENIMINKRESKILVYGPDNAWILNFDGDIIKELNISNAIEDKFLCLQDMHTGELYYYNGRGVLMW